MQSATHSVHPKLKSTGGGRSKKLLQTQPKTDGKGAPFRANLRRIVLERIVCGELAPGIRIKESHMAKELGTSRTPLREALINLEQEGFVQSERACGFSVPPLTGREVREIYPILWTLEGLALRASGNAVCSQIDDLLRINTEFAGSEDANERIRCDARWHEALLSSCPNRRLNALIGSLRNAIRRYEHIYMSDAALVLGSVQQHQQIIEALKAKNGIEAEKLLADNWRLGMELLLVRLGEP